MNRAFTSYQNYDSKLGLFINRIFTSNNIISAFCQLLVLLYISQLSPNMPSTVVTVFSNPYFRLVVFALILVAFHISPSLALLLSAAFIMTVNISNNKPVWEFLDNTVGTFSPSTGLGVTTASTNLDSSLANPQPVSGVMQQSATSTIQPSIVNTPNGTVVTNPAVVIAPLAVTQPNGSTVMVTPSVTYVNANSNGSGNGMTDCGLGYYYNNPTDMTKVKPIGPWTFHDYGKFNATMTSTTANVGVFNPSPVTGTPTSSSS